MVSAAEEMALQIVVRRLVSVRGPLRRLRGVRYRRSLPHEGLQIAQSGAKGLNLPFVLAGASLGHTHLDEGFGQSQAIVGQSELGEGPFRQLSGVGKAPLVTENGYAAQQ